MRYFIFLFTCLLLLAPAGVALADSAPMQTVGPHVQPMDSTTVRLESERIDIHLREDHGDPAGFRFSGVADYRIQFHFVPTADEQMTAGFPLFVWDPKKSIYGAHLQDFRVFADGQELTTKLKGGFIDGTNVDWAIFDLTFKAGKPLDLEITYSMNAVPYGKTQAADLWISYVLRTGAFWAGTIGHAEAHLTMNRPIRAEDIRSGDVWRATTPGWRLEDGALHWTWDDVEPDFDLSIVMANAFWLDSPDALAELAATDGLGRDGCLKLMQGMTVFFEGDGRGGMWLPVRGGKNSGQVGEGLWPDVAQVLQGCLARAPQDHELRERYLRLLSASVWHWENGVTSLVSDERLRMLLREYLAYKEAVGRAPGGAVVLWLETEIPGLKLSEETQAEVVAVLVAEEMYSSFATEQAAREWVAKAAGPLGAPARDALLKEALGRVKPGAGPGPAPSPAPAAGDQAPVGGPAAPQGPAGEPGPDQAAAAEATPPQAPGAGSASPQAPAAPAAFPLLLAGGLALLALGAAALLSRKLRRPGSARE